MSVLFFCMSTISANEVYVNTTGNDDTGDGSAGNPYLTIQKGISSIQDNGTLKIGNGKYSGVNNTNITIDRNMNIIGESQAGTIIDGENLNRIFFIPSGVNVNIYNLTFINGNNTGSGAIQNNGTLTVNNCIFTSNTAGWNGTSTNYGGAINNQGTLTVNNSIFNNNDARVGGAIYNSPYATLNVNNSIFTNNAGKLGGAIYNHGTSFVKSSTFTDNTAVRGGAIFNLNYDQLLDVDNCIFTNNNALYFGGAIYNNDGNVTVKGSFFTGNSAPEIGGAIYNEGILNVMGCIFTGNTANNGGAIYNWRTLTVTGSTFTRNLATSRGGAIYIYNRWGNAIANLNFNRIVGNTASEGSAIYNDGGTVDATKNWWGSNTSPAEKLFGNVTYDPWIVMKLNPTKTVINGGTTTTLIANFHYDNRGVYHDPANGHIPDGTPVTFKTNLGQVGSQIITKYTVNGIATAILKAWDTAGNPVSGTAYITATTDTQTLTSNVTILPVVNAASNTVGMQETGLPVNYLILAVLMVISGLLVPKRK